VDEETQVSSGRTWALFGTQNKGTTGKLVGIKTSLEKKNPFMTNGFSDFQGIS
jgi:hypothetical protein